MNIPQVLAHRYQPIRLLGRGAWGEVYLAMDNQLQRQVAVKLQVLKDRERRARFEHETRALTALNHPGVVRLYAAGVHGETGWMVMERIAGKPLDQAEQLPRLDAMLSMAEGLEAAHARGIVHRDVKPANVLFDGRRAVLVDFGLAKSSDWTRVTAERFVVGTIGYMAPEVLREAAPTPAADWYGWGASLYRLYEGRVPFDKEALVARAFSDDAVPPLFRQLKPGSPVATLIEACLHVDPARRPSSRAEIEDLLERSASGPIRVPVPESSTRPCPLPGSPAPAGRGPATARWLGTAVRRTAQLLSAGLAALSLACALPTVPQGAGAEGLAATAAATPRVTASAVEAAVEAAPLPPELAPREVASHQVEHPEAGAPGQQRWWDKRHGFMGFASSSDELMERQHSRLGVFVKGVAPLTRRLEAEFELAAAGAEVDQVLAVTGRALTQGAAWVVELRQRGSTQVVLPWGSPEEGSAPRFGSLMFFQDLGSERAAPRRTRRVLLPAGSLAEGKLRVRVWCQAPAGQVDPMLLPKIDGLSLRPAFEAPAAE